MRIRFRQDFEQFVLDSVESEAEEMALEDYLCLWRARQETDATRAAIQEGLDDLDAGRVCPAEEVLAELLFRAEPVPRDHVAQRGEVVDLHLYRLAPAADGVFGLLRDAGVVDGDGGGEHRE